MDCHLLPGIKLLFGTLDFDDRNNESIWLSLFCNGVVKVVSSLFFLLVYVISVVCFYVDTTILVLSCF
jgi:energy-converting hydrogenase Eha subunit C